MFQVKKVEDVVYDLSLRGLLPEEVGKLEEKDREAAVAEVEDMET